MGDTHYSTLGRLREPISLLLYPLQWIATQPLNLFRKGKDFLTLQTYLLAENRRLNDAQLAASLLAIKMKALEAENKHLRGLRTIQQGLPQPAQLVEILYSGRDPFSAQLIVDRGKATGMVPGQAVIDHQGLVGQVIRVQPLTSQIRLISDRNHIVPVIVERTQLRAILYGMGHHQLLEIHNLTGNIDIREGDDLLTSGIDGIYPAGLPVARVVSIQRNTGNVFARVLCKPIAEIDQHRYFLALQPPTLIPPYPAEQKKNQPPSKKKKPH